MDEMSTLLGNAPSNFAASCPFIRVPRIINIATVDRLHSAYLDGLAVQHKEINKYRFEKIRKRLTSCHCDSE